MAGTYRTVTGETWDMIAKNVYGNELRADFLMENNPKLIEVFVFSNGTLLNTPDLPAEEKLVLPPWRKR